MRGWLGMCGGGWRSDTECQNEGNPSLNYLAVALEIVIMSLICSHSSARVE